MPKVVVAHEGPVTIVTIDRYAEARNAVDPETAEALRGAFLAFERDESRSVAILTGAGQAFCSGFDMKALAKGDGAQGPRARRSQGARPRTRALSASLYARRPPLGARAVEPELGGCPQARGAYRA